MNRISVLLACLYIVLIALCSCTDADVIQGATADRKEGKFATAIVTEDGQGGATVPWVERVYLERTGAAVEILKAIHVRDLSIMWSGERRLSIRMACGEILNFVNYFDAYSADRTSFERIEVHLDAAGLCPESWPPRP